VDVDTFTEAAIHRPEVLAVAARVEHREDAAPAPEFAGAVEVVTRDGRRLAAEERASAAPEPTRIRGKFEATAGRLLSRAGVARLAAAVAELPATSPGALTALCRCSG
jgi:hypothetical protein